MSSRKTRDGDGRHSLHQAAVTGEIDEVARLIADGADVAVMPMATPRSGERCLVSREGIQNSSVYCSVPVQIPMPRMTPTDLRATWRRPLIALESVLSSHDELPQVKRPRFEMLCPAWTEVEGGCREAPQV